MRWRVRTLMAVIASVTCLLGLSEGAQRRGETFRKRACYREQAASPLFSVEVGEVCTSGDDDPNAFERNIADRGEGAWRAYKASEYHTLLAEKYAAASKRPWIPVGADPRSPAGTYPRFEFDPSAELVTGADWSASVGGFR